MTTCADAPKPSSGIAPDTGGTSAVPLPTGANTDGPCWTETLRDGAHVLIRPIRPEDAALEKKFIERLSPTSRRYRFLGSIGEPSEELIRRLTWIDHHRAAAFVALVHRDGETREVGVSRFCLDADGRSCECAVTVADEWQHKGLGVILMRHLIEVARARGIRSMVSYDAAENAGMRDLAAFLGFHRTADPDDPRQVIYTLPLAF